MLQLVFTAVMSVLFNIAGLQTEEPLLNGVGLLFAIWFAVLVSRDIAGGSETE